MRDIGTLGGGSLRICSHCLCVCQCVQACLWFFLHMFPVSHGHVLAHPSCSRCFFGWSLSVQECVHRMCILCKIVSNAPDFHWIFIFCFPPPNCLPSSLLLCPPDFLSAKKFSQQIKIFPHSRSLIRRKPPTRPMFLPFSWKRWLSMCATIWSPAKSPIWPLLMPGMRIILIGAIVGVFFFTHCIHTTWGQCCYLLFHSFSPFLQSQRTAFSVVVYFFCSWQYSQIPTTTDFCGISPFHL